jgi:hypothetical protein
VARAPLRAEPRRSELEPAREPRANFPALDQTAVHRSLEQKLVLAARLVVVAFVGQTQMRRAWDHDAGGSQLGRSFLVHWLAAWLQVVCLLESVISWHLIGG